VIVLQSKVITDWFTGQRFLWAISVSVADILGAGHPGHHHAAGFLAGQ
jgi:hypothetical protein